MEKRKKMSNRSLATIFSLAVLSALAADFVAGNLSDSASKKRMTKMEQETKAHINKLKK